MNMTMTLLPRGASLAACTVIAAAVLFAAVSGRSRKRLLEKQFRQRQTDHGGGAQTSRRAGGPAQENREAVRHEVTRAKAGWGPRVDAQAHIWRGLPEQFHYPRRGRRHQF